MLYHAHTSLMIVVETLDIAGYATQPSCQFSRAKQSEQSVRIDDCLSTFYFTTFQQLAVQGIYL